MPPNHKLTNLIKGRTVERSTGGAGKCVITFADGSALTIKSATTLPDLSGSVTAVFEGDDLELLFDNGSRHRFTLSNPGASVAVRDASGKVEYLG